MLGRCTLAGLLTLACVSVLLARQGIVKTNDGRTLQGDITEEKDSVTVSTHGGQITVPRDSIASLDYVGNLKAQYEQRLARLGPNPSVKDHLELARWLFQGKEYDLARAEAEKAKRIEPENKDADILINTIYRTRLLEGRTPRPATGTGPVASAPATKPLPAGARKLLDAEQMQVIKRIELTRRDNNVRVKFDNNVVKRFIEFKGIPAGDFVGMADVEKAKMILAEGAGDLAQDVKILSDPLVIGEYKQLQRGILSGCASTNCHGGARPGNFLLYSPADTDAATYTNFYILAKSAQSIEGVRYKMLNRTQPKDSLLLQYGLPRAGARLPHPDVPNFRAPFVNTDAPPYRTVIQWISSLRMDEVDYKLDFALPTGPAPASRPAP